MLDSYLRRLPTMETFCRTGEVTELVGLLVQSQGPQVPVGSFCEILTDTGRVRSQVVGFRDGKVLSIPLEEVEGVRLGNTIVAREGAGRIAVGPSLLGRVLDGLGQPIDSGPAIEPEAFYSLHGTPVNPLDRQHIDEQLVTGIRVLDGMLACGKGQRIGLFGGSGVGKSTLLGSMARQSSADVIVLALIGERNREVKAFIEHELGEEGLAKSVVVVATSDRPAPLRVRACFVALAIAEYFRDAGKSMLLVMDSVTRLAMAQREIGLAAGEPPSQKGYTPSVFSIMPKVFERAGCFESGSITGFFTVLVEGDDMNEPIADAVRGILDGHVVLSRELGQAGHFPAIDVLQSVSRVMPQLVSKTHMRSANKIRQTLAEYRRAEDLIRLGAYVSGTSPRLDAGIRAQDDLNRFLRQEKSETSALPETVAEIDRLSSLLV